MGLQSKYYHFLLCLFLLWNMSCNSTGKPEEKKKESIQKTEQESKESSQKPGADTIISTTEENDATQQKVHYHLTDKPGPGDIIVGEVKGIKEVLINQSDSLCLTLIAVKDFDQDGWEDALVENITACGGNGAGSAYFFLSYLPDKGFVRTEEYGFSWGDDQVSFEEINGKPCVKFRFVNEGMTKADFEEIFLWLTLKAGKAVVLKKYQTPEIPAIKELRAKAFLSTETKELKFDLNGDGLSDVIEGNIWIPWGRIKWEVTMTGNSVVYESRKACRRIGVLPSKTNGVNDLVCDCNDVLRWDGEKYEL